MSYPCETETAKCIPAGEFAVPPKDFGANYRAEWQQSRGTAELRQVTPHIPGRREAGARG